MSAKYELLAAALPDNYIAARTALVACTRVDECITWANQMHALASYARQSKDESLAKMALRIKARATQRYGQLLAAIPPQKGKRTDCVAGGAPSRLQIARNNGLSRRQMRVAIQIAAVPTEKFERAVEGNHPPSMSRLAKLGVRNPNVSRSDLVKQLEQIYVQHARRRRSDEQKLAAEGGPPPKLLRLLVALQETAFLMNETAPAEMLKCFSRETLDEPLNVLRKWCERFTNDALTCVCTVTSSPRELGR